MNDKQIDDYLLNEMSEAEREKFENEFFVDDDKFYDVADRENELVDAYLRDDLRGEQLRRFEQSLRNFPARRHKIENARVIHELIAENRAHEERKTITIAERRGWITVLADILGLRSPLLQYGALGLIVILAISGALLLRENRRLGSLEQELASARSREAELATRVETEQDVSSDLTADLGAERERVQQLESEIEKLRSAGTNTSVTRPQAAAPTVATLILGMGIRGAPLRSLELAPGVTRIAIVAPVSKTSVERVAVRLNGDILGGALPVRTRKGERSVTITIPVDRVSDGRNTLSVSDQAGNQIEEFAFTVTRRK